MPPPATPLPARPVFLSAAWHHLLMINYEIAPALLAPFVPPGTELDFFHYRTFISLVGFRFLHTRLLRLPIPFHRNFDEINLRFYVRRILPNGEVRRGVAFIRELVPRSAIALIARLAYNEPYIACPMKSTVPLAPPHSPETPGRVAYSFRSNTGWHHLAATPIATPALAPPDSEEAFITEHYWGYTRQRNNTTVEYQVSHPSWRLWTTHTPELSPALPDFYGPPFAAVLCSAPTSALLAEGSPVQVFRPTRLA